MRSMLLQGAGVLALALQKAFYRLSQAALSIGGSFFLCACQNAQDDRREPASQSLEQPYVGDDERDMVAGRSAGMPTVRCGALQEQGAGRTGAAPNR